MLAAPSAPKAEAIAVALLEVADRPRLVRLEHRDPGKWSREAKRDLVGWGRWHRAHAADPGHHPEVLTSGGWSEMRWDRWTSWQVDDPRWRTEVFDTTGRDVAACARDVTEWIARVRSDPTWPLRRGWDSA